MSSPVLHRIDPKAIAQGMPDVVFQCPGCNCGHGVWTSKPNHLGAQWTWNEDMVRPTFSPSLNITWGGGPDDVPRGVCHSFVRDGQIEFLSDCTHSLAGKTVPLPSSP
jgi:hypothetical protein